MTLAAAAAVALALGGFGLTRLTETTPTRASDTPSGSNLGAPPAPLRVKGKVRVKPATAQVAVQGNLVAPDPQGDVPLEGEPGDPIEVAVTVGTETRKVRVLLSRSGEAQPAEIDASPPPVASALPSGATPQLTAKIPGKLPGLARTPAPPATPTATSTTPGKVKIKDDLD